MNQNFEIYDDSGFLGIVNNSLYEGYVNEDWELEELFEKIRTQINLGNCVVWSTGYPNLMKLEIRDTSSLKKSFRDSYLNIKVTNDEVWLVNYTDLTMSAQFKDETIPSDENSDLRINLANGYYKVIIRQMFNPEDFEEYNNSPNFEIIFQAIDKFEDNKCEKIIWWEG